MLNYVTAADIIASPRLVQKGKVMSFALPFDLKMPPGGISDTGQSADSIRFTSCFARPPMRMPAFSITARFAVRTISSSCQPSADRNGRGSVTSSTATRCGTAATCRTVTSFGAQKCRIEKTRDKIGGRGVLLDIPRMLDMDWLPDGFGVTNELQDRAEKYLGVTVRRGDFLLVRTGLMEAKFAAKTWDGYAGGDALGLAFETLDWLHGRQVAGIVTDTWGVEVRPNQTADARQPWHWIAIPIIGLSVGEIYYLADLSEDCADD